jgi:hypothetical protein
VQTRCSSANHRSTSARPPPAEAAAGVSGQAPSSGGAHLPSWPQQPAHC